MLDNEIIRKVRGLIPNFNSTWVLLFICGVNLFIMHYYILFTCKLDYENDFSLIIDNLLGICFDVLIVALFTYFLSGKKLKLYLTLTFIITWIWSLSSIIYSRFFFNYLSISAVGQGGALSDDLIIKCILANIHLTDLYFPCVVIVFFLLLPNVSDKNFLIHKVVLLFLLLLPIDIGAHVACCITNPKLRYTSYIFHRIYNNHFVKHLNLSNPKAAHFIRGELRTIGTELLFNIQGNIKLTKEQIAQIKSIQSNSNNSVSDSTIVSQSANIIFILVESYMSFTSDMIIDGKEVTPFLNSLKKDSTIYYNGKMRKNVTLGGSSDGQFIYMTGLLPLRSILTLTKAHHVTLPGLPKILGRESRMIIPTVTSIWDQDEMCRQYGFDKLYARNDYSQEIDENLTDEQVFQLAIQKDKVSSQPFFSIILTMSMHQPYEEQIDSTFLIKNPSITDELANYLNVCHYTDRQIEKYFHYLIESGLYNNSLIIIAADHPVDNTDFGGVCNDVPLYIVNPGVDPSIMWQGECNQVDVYTTILDLVGCKSEWYGLGHSLVSSEYNNTVSTETWDVSEWILMGDYFHNNHFFKSSETKKIDVTY